MDSAPTSTLFGRQAQTTPVLEQDCFKGALDQSARSLVKGIGVVGKIPPCSYDLGFKHKATASMHQPIPWTAAFGSTRN